MLRNAKQTARLRAKELRTNLSLPEALLWRALREARKELRIHRQYAIDTYTLDFYVPAAWLCIEIDGLTHEGRYERDHQRDERLAALGIETVRVAAASVLQDPDQVAEFIRLRALERMRELGN